MDPQVTWEDMLRCVSAQQLDEARDHANNLSHWLAQGGFPPQTVPLIPQGDELHRVIAVAVVRHLLALDE